MRSRLNDLSIILTDQSSGSKSPKNIKFPIFNYKLYSPNNSNVQ